MAERVRRAGFGQQLAVGVRQSLGHADAAVAEASCVIASTRARNRASSNGISGNSSTSGIGVSRVVGHADSGGDPAGVAPITSSTKTFVDVLAIDATSNAASRIDVATYLATEPKPGQLSVTARSLSTVFGTWIALQRIAELRRDLRNLEAGIRRVVAAVVEEVADVVRAKHVDQPLVLRARLARAP